MYSTDPRWLQLRVSYVDGPVILNDVACTGSPRQNLTDCTRNGYGLFPYCSSVAYAICEGKHFLYLVGIMYACMICDSVFL